MKRGTIAMFAAAAVLGLVTACSSPAPSGGPSEPSQAGPSDSSAAGGEDIVENPPAKSWQDALKAARADFSGEVSKIELEPRRGGGLEYKVELMSADTEYAVQFDADSLEKLSDKKDDLGDDAAEKQKETFNPDELISLEEAANAARDQQEGTITKWKIEGKDTGLVQYEFDIRPEGAAEDVEVQINAKDGSLVKDS